jgi:hypothetical protein
MSPSVFAGDDYYSEPEYQALNEYDFDLEIETNGKKVELEWNEFESDERLKWWKFVFSQSDSTPMYPDNDAQYLGDNVNLTEKVVWMKPGNYYVRLCAITQEMGRHCSRVQKVEISEYEKEEYNNKDYYGNDEKPKEDYKKDYYEKKKEVKNENYEKKKEVKEYNRPNSVSLSDEMKEKVEEAVEWFIKRLEDKGYDDDEMSDTINAVIKKLEVLKKQSKYTALASYMIEILREESQEYNDDFGDLEDLLNEF